MIWNLGMLSTIDEFQAATDEIMSKSKGGRNKSKLVTYILWLLGGIFGLHHFYLGRDIQGFLWWCTLGGYFGCGWLSDIFHLSEYVADANRDKEYVKKFKDTVRKNKKPPYSSMRYLGMVMFAYLWSSVLTLAIPEDEVFGYDLQWLHIFVPLACALGIWSVGNIGHQRGKIWWPLFASYASWPLKYFMADESTAFLITALLSALAFDAYAKEWRPERERKTSFIKRLFVIGMCCLLYASLWASGIYFNAKLTTADGEEIPIREALYHFFKSPWWLDVKQSFVDVWEFYKHHGWSETWRQIIDLSDPLGEQNAFKVCPATVFLLPIFCPIFIWEFTLYLWVLELSSGASQSEINTKCRSLAVKYHPDKFKTEEEKLSAQEHFYEIQQACELLSNSRAKRKRRNKNFDR